LCPIPYRESEDREEVKTRRFLGNQALSMLGKGIEALLREERMRLHATIWACGPAPPPQERRKDDDV
jgi:hypothetical protein